MFDIVIRNGRVVDGTGNPWYYGDVGVSKGRISAIGRMEGADAATVIDADGMAVCPGFIDMHPHADVMLLGEPRHDAKLRQGVTTELLGQDGLSYAPLSPEKLQAVRRYLSGLNGDPEIGWDWSSVGEFLARFERTTSANVAYLVPHCALRLESMGWGNRLASEAERSKMRELTAQAMEDGAVGFSTGLTYPPGCYSDTEELVEICEVVARYGGIYVTHLRGRMPQVRDVGLDPIEEALEIGRRTGVPVHFSHFKSAEGLARVERVREKEGIDATVDSYPYRAGSGMLQANILPRWVHEGGPDAIVERLRNPKSRRRIELNAGWRNNVICSVRSERNRAYVGRLLPDLVAESGKEPLDFVCDLLLEEDLAVSRRGEAGPESHAEVIGHSLHLASSDGLPLGRCHPRTYGSFPRYLGPYVRDFKVLRLEEAVAMMSGRPAARIGLKDRGLLKVGFAADIVIFDPETVEDRATYEDPLQYPAGIPYVLVNGEIVIDREEHTGAFPGRALRPLL